MEKLVVNNILSYGERELTSRRNVEPRHGLERIAALHTDDHRALLAASRK